uniref:Putative retrotransposon Ty1-copia subclass protein n=1 Tax=Tanacetum cinerariifolium TaxID=118510 RepID=A0A6L2K3K3_TANCI|nr:putative retrotransposon Ty1-copia subclass protein [Tanacetum cinerariifolium]
MGYHFYYLLENKIFVARNAEFFEKIPQALDRYGFNVDVEEYELGDLNEPPNYKAALSDHEFDKWLEAMNTKMQSMKDNQVWVLVDLPPNGRTVGSKWVFKKKTDMDGNVHTFKARLVAKRYTQTYSIDYEEIFSHVVDIRAIRILLAIVAFYDYEIWKSAKKSTNAMSSTEAEYIAAAEASMESVWMRKFIDGLGEVDLSKDMSGLESPPRTLKKLLGDEGLSSEGTQLNSIFITAKHKRYAKDPTKIHDIKRRQNEGLQAFMDRFKYESSHIKGVPLVLRISAFMHGHGHPELTKKLNDKIPKTVDEMFERVRAFIRGEVAAGSAEMVRPSPGDKGEVGSSGEGHPPEQLVEQESRKERCKGHNLIKEGVNHKRPFEKGRSGLTDELTFLAIPMNQLTDEPIILEGVIKGNHIQRILVDGGSSSEIMYEHCFRNLNVNIRSKLRRCRNLMESQQWKPVGGSMGMPIAKKGARFMKGGIKELSGYTSEDDGEEREGIQIPVSYVSRPLQGMEIRYTPTEKIIHALIHTTRSLRTIFRKQKVKVVTDGPIEKILKSRREGQLARCATEVRSYNISYIPRKEAEGSVAKKFFGRETIEEGSGVGIILVSLEEKMYSYAIRLKFNASNHAMDCEALLVGLAASTNQGTKDLHYFIDSLTLVSQEVSVGIKTRPSVEETSSTKKGKETRNMPEVKPNYNCKASGSN